MLLAPTLALVIAQSAARYHITFPATDPLHPEVEATIPVSGGEVHTGEGAINQIARGWASFVSITSADVGGTPVELTESTKDHWKVPKDGLLHLRYKVDLSFAKTKWPPGNEQGAKLVGQSIFSVTKPLFVASLEVPAQVEITPPNGWNVGTGWVADAAGRFQVQNQEELLVNSLVISPQRLTTVSAGPLDFQLAFLGDSSRDAAPVIPALTRIVREFVGVFPNTPRSKYLVTFFYDRAEDGESYRSSAAFTTKAKIGKSNTINWANTMAHELFHMWNGHLLKGDTYEDMQWFSEGFTEYFANMAVVRTGAVAFNDFLRKVEKHSENYLYWRASAAFQNGSLRVAGKQKSIDRFAVYDGGWCLALWLDLNLLKATNLKTGLEPFMAELFTTSGKGTLSVSQFVNVVRSHLGPKMAADCSDYIEGKTAIPVETTLALLGIGGTFQDYAGEVYLTVDHSNPDAASFLKRWVTGR